MAEIVMILALLIANVASAPAGRNHRPAPKPADCIVQQTSNDNC